MSTDQLHVERRGSQRFEYHLPVNVRVAGTNRQGNGFTQDLSGRGALFYTDFAVAEGEAVELTLVMPSEITLAENMRVCCRGKVVRVQQAGAASKSAVAVHIEKYEFLPDAPKDASSEFSRISALHEHKTEAKAVSRPARVSPEV